MILFTTRAKKVFLATLPIWCGPTLSLNAGSVESWPKGQDLAVFLI